MSSDVSAHTLPLKIAPSSDGRGPHLTRGSFGPPQHPKRHLDRFSRFYTAQGREFLYFTMGRSFPPKCTFP